MAIESVTIDNGRTTPLTLSLSNYKETGLLITNIEGMEHPQGSITTAKKAVSDGEMYVSSRLDNRDILIELRLLGKDAHVQRNMLYSVVPVKQKVRLTFNTTLHNRYIEGYVEEHNVDIFDEEPTFKFSVYCPDPHFRDLSSSQIRDNWSRNFGTFEFPFPREPYSVGDTFQFGVIPLVWDLNFVNEGNVDVGGILTIKVRKEIDTIGVSVNGDRFLLKKPADNYPVGTEIVINSVIGEKDVRMNGKSILSDMDISSVWPVYRSGRNVVKPIGVNRNDVSMQLTLDNLYYGV